MPDGEFQFGAVSVNGEIYAIGHNFTYVLDPSTDTWVSKMQMPSHRQGFAIAVFQNKIYVIGGWNSINPNTGIAITLGANEMYDPASDTWTTKAPMPLPTSNMEANVVEGKIYVISGLSDIATFTFSSSNWVYDPSSNSWATLSAIPSPVFNYASAVLDNKIYVEGGNGVNLAVSNLNQVYDTETNTWILGQPLPLPVRLEGAGATTGLLASARLYIVGGTNNGYDGVKANQIYNPQTDQWTFGAEMPTARLVLAVAFVNDTLYALGGISSSGPQNNAGAVYAVDEQYIPVDYQGPTPSPYIPTPSPYPTNTPTPTQTQSPSPSLSPSPSPSLTPSPSPSPSPSNSPTQQPTLEPTQTPSPNSEPK